MQIFYLALQCLVRSGDVVFFFLSYFLTPPQLCRGTILKLENAKESQIEARELTLLTKEIGVCQSSEDWRVLLIVA